MYCAPFHQSWIPYIPELTHYILLYVFTMNIWKCFLQSICLLAKKESDFLIMLFFPHFLKLNALRLNLCNSVSIDCFWKEMEIKEDSSYHFWENNMKFAKRNSWSSRGRDDSFNFFKMNQWLHRFYWKIYSRFVTSFEASLFKVEGMREMENVGNHRWSVS